MGGIGTSAVLIGMMRGVRLNELGSQHSIVCRSTKPLSHSPVIVYHETSPHP